MLIPTLRNRLHWMGLLAALTLCGCIGHRVAKTSSPKESPERAAALVPPPEEYEAVREYRLAPVPDPLSADVEHSLSRPKPRPDGEPAESQRKLVPRTARKWLWFERRTITVGQVLDMLPGREPQQDQPLAGPRSKEQVAQSSHPAVPPLNPAPAAPTVPAGHFASESAPLHDNQNQNVADSPHWNPFDQYVTLGAPDFLEPADGYYTSIGNQGSNSPPDWPWLRTGAFGNSHPQRHAASRPYGVAEGARFGRRAGSLPYGVSGVGRQAGSRLYEPSPTLTWSTFVPNRTRTRQFPSEPAPYEFGHTLGKKATANSPEALTMEPPQWPSF